MTLIRYQPWDLFGQIQRDMNRLLESHLGEAARDADNSSVVTSHWTPAVDIKEEVDRFVIYADLPGVEVKDIEITMDQGVLAIKGERKWATDEDREGYRRVERARGTFYRRFSLPDSADAERIQARGREGVLEVVIPKLQKVQPRKIAVEG
jgi:HSP20 family protein